VQLFRQDKKRAELSIFKCHNYWLSQKELSFIGIIVRKKL